LRVIASILIEAGGWPFPNPLMRKVWRHAAPCHFRRSVGLRHYGHPSGFGRETEALLLVPLYQNAEAANG
jgi:hypothetical protein